MPVAPAVEATNATPRTTVSPASATSARSGRPILSRYRGPTAGDVGQPDDPPSSRGGTARPSRPAFVDAAFTHAAFTHAAFTHAAFTHLVPCQVPQWGRLTQPRIGGAGLSTAPNPARNPAPNPARNPAPNRARNPARSSAASSGAVVA